MITCENCGSDRVLGRFNFASCAYEWVCQTCGTIGPVTHEDAATLRYEQAEAIRNLMQVCEGKPWSTFHTRGEDRKDDGL